MEGPSTKGRSRSPQRHSVQNAAMALSIADRGYVLSTGEIVLEGPASQLLRSEDLKRAYLGG